MPPANPSPAERPARRTARQKPAPQKEAQASTELSDLLTEIRFLKGLVENLQQEVIDLRADRSDRTPATDSSEPEPVFAKNLPERDFAVEFAEAMAGSCEEASIGELEAGSESVYETEGEFAPFEPDVFAQDFALAFDSPEPIDWGSWSEDDESPEAPEFLDSWDAAEGDDTAMVDMIKRHPVLIKDVLSFNRHNPPDYAEESSFDDAVRRADHDSLMSGADDPEPIVMESQALPTAHDLMAELVAEASKSQAVMGAPGFDAPPPADLSDFGEPKDASDPLFDLEYSGADLSYAPAFPLRHTSKRLSEEILERIPAVPAIRACLLPLDLDDGVLTAGAPKPFDMEAVEEFEKAVGIKVTLKAMPIEDVIYGLREGYDTRDEDDFRAPLLSGAAPSVPRTLMERALELLWFLKRT
mgnify:CR=1 FL=1